VIRIIQGDCRVKLRELPAESVHCCVTSPPYWGLRSYGTPPLVWGGDENCQHEWVPWGSETCIHEEPVPFSGETKTGGIQLQSKRTATGDTDCNREDPSTIVNTSAMPKIIQGITKPVGKTSTSSGKTDSGNLINMPVAIEISSDETVDGAIGDVRPLQGQTFAGSKSEGLKQINKSHRPDVPTEHDGTSLRRLSSDRALRGKGIADKDSQRLICADESDLPIITNVTVGTEQSKQIGCCVSPLIKEGKIDLVSTQAVGSPEGRTASSGTEMVIRHSAMPIGAEERLSAKFTSNFNSGITAGGGASPTPSDLGRPDLKTTSATCANQGNWHDQSSATNICQKCGAVKSSLGLEPTPELFVEHLVEVMREVKRVLRDDGTLWLNLGDSYASTPQADNHADPKAPRRIPDGRCRTNALKPKDLCGIPWRVAFALQADGWWLRSDIIWAKPNCMPESVTDRPTRSHEYVFLMSKSARYFYDADAVREKFDGPRHAPGNKTQRRIGARAATDPAQDPDREWGNPAGRNKRTVWTILTSPFPDAHFATFPPALVEPMIRAGTSERGVCPTCLAPWVRVVEKGDFKTLRGGKPFCPEYGQKMHGMTDLSGIGMTNADGFGSYEKTTTGWRPTCDCQNKLDRSVLKGTMAMSEGIIIAPELTPVPATCLDPFSGAGTVGLVADRLGRDAILIDLSADYCEMGRERIEGDAPMFVDVKRG